MYRIPAEIDLSPVVGEFTTQIAIGQFDLQFSFGRIRFAVWSPVNLFRDGERVGYWEPGQWPDAAFYDIMNAKVQKCDVVGDQLIVFEFENGLAMHLEDSSDQYESMEIRTDESSYWII